MKNIAILSALVLVAGAAMAQEPGSSFDIAPSTFTRAEVKADYSNAVKTGTLVQTGKVGEFAVPAATGPTRSVANVRAEGRQAARAYTTFGEV